VDATKHNNFVVVERGAVAASLKNSELGFLCHLKFAPQVVLEVEDPSVVQS
jgi:hypothetical protein